MTSYDYDYEHESIANNEYENEGTIAPASMTPMSTRHQTRELAMQALYQLDARGEEADEHIERAIGGAPHAEASKAGALALARAAWTSRDAADALSAELAPAWPPKRQPPVDRSIIRLAYHELTCGTPPAIVIDEAVELAKAYGSERSGAFVNGVLDQMARRITPAPEPEPEPGQKPETPTGDPFLDDALKKSRPTR